MNFNRNLLRSVQLGLAACPEDKTKGDPELPVSIFNQTHDDAEIQTSEQAQWSEGNF
jgi:hypothetical protein